MNQIKREIKRFVVAGLSAVSVDLTTYYMLLLLLSHNISKAISFTLGATVAFAVNKYWTFEKTTWSHKEVIQFAILYCTTLVANVFTNQAVLSHTGLVLFAFLIATCVSTVLNFLGQKFLVFR